MQLSGSYNRCNHHSQQPYGLLHKVLVLEYRLQPDKEYSHYPNGSTVTVF